MPESQTIQAGQYYLLEKIAQGGMAEIYKGLAYDPAGIKKAVCIKKILSHISASREFVDMLVDEAKIAVKLNQGNIAQIYDLGKAGDDYFIVMEYVEGQNLGKIHKKILRQGKRIPLAIACYIIAEVAGGLDYMHRKTDEEGKSLNVIHRDISPQNIVISYSGTVKIIDFGIAKAAVKIGHTESGILKGKFAYMSPEQARGDKLDHRSDIFSLGIILHELLTGKRLFKASDNKQTLKNVRATKVSPPSTIHPELPPTIDDIVMKALAKDRRHRYAFASNFRDDLLKFLHSQYPDFKVSLVADFVRNLFQEELKIRQKLGEQESATPHLILDKTRPPRPGEEAGETTQGGAAIDWREFMLEVDWPEGEEAEKQRSREAEKQEAGSKDEEEALEAELSEATARKWLADSSFTKQAITLSLVLTFLLAFGIAGYFGWKYFQTSNFKSPTSNLKLPNKPQIPSAIEEPKLAALIVESNPPGASIYLDDKETGLVTPLELKDLPPGRKHILGLYLTNHKFFKTPFETKEGEKLTFHVELAIDYGSLKIASNPSGAIVAINNQVIGSTPLTKEELVPGSIVKIEIKHDGFATFSQELQIAAGKEHVVSAGLERLVPLPVPPSPPIINEENNEP